MTPEQIEEMQARANRNRLLRDPVGAFHWSCDQVIAREVGEDVRPADLAFAEAVLAPPSPRDLPGGDQ